MTFMTSDIPTLRKTSFFFLKGNFLLPAWVDGDHACVKSNPDTINTPWFVSFHLAASLDYPS